MRRVSIICPRPYKVPLALRWLRIWLCVSVATLPLLAAAQQNAADFESDTPAVVTEQPLAAPGEIADEDPAAADADRSDTAETEPAAPVTDQPNADNTQPAAEGLITKAEPDTEATPSATVAPPVAPAPAGPDTTIWIDDQGKPRPVVGLSYEELSQAWRLLQDLQQPSDAPRYIRDAFHATGTVSSDRAELEVRYDITLPAGGEVAVPLGFSGAILAGKASIEDAAEETTESPTAATSAQYVDYDAALGGYVVWLRGEPGAGRVVTLPLLVPLERDGTQTMLRANIPRTIHSQLALEMPARITEPYASASALLDVSTADNGNTRLEVSGAVGEFQLGWSEPTPGPQQQRTVLSVEGQIFTEIDGRSVRSQAKLVVESYGGELERFRVRLPAGATLIPTTHGPSTSGDLADDQPRVTRILDDDSGSDRPLCLVTLPQRTSAPVTVQIVTEQAVGLDDQPQIDLAGFEVIGAIRQYGDVAIRVAEDWRLRWDDIRDARRMDITSLPADMVRPGLTAAVRYYQQPWKLGVEISLVGKRIEATPRYRLEIKPDKALLHTRVAYRIPGARVSGFSIELGDWSDQIGVPTGAAVAGNLARLNKEMLYIPLLQPTSGRTDVEFTLSRDMAPREERISLRMPIAQAESQGVADLIVVVDPSLQLIPDTSRMKRLRAVPLRPEDYDPADPTGLRTFRFQGFLPDQVFAAQKRLRPGEVEVSIQSNVTLSEFTTTVQQLFDYQVRYEPIEQVRLVAPTELLTADGLRLDMLPAVTSDAAAADDPITIPLPFRLGEVPEADDSRMEAIVDLPRPWLGDFRIRVSYDLTGGVRDFEFSEVIEAGLLTPLDVPQTSHTFVARAESGLPLALAPDRNGWSVVADGDASNDTLRLTTDTTAPNVALAQRRKETQTVAGPLLRRSWLQSWVTPTQIQQRAVFQFDSQSDVATVDLPLHVVSDSVEVYLDGQPLRDVERTERQLLVPLPTATATATATHRHTLEVRYFDTPAEGLGTLAWQPARLVADQAMSESYWQVVLPATQHLWETPAGFAPAMRWATEAGYWGRQPRLDTEKLQKWAGAVDRSAPSAAEHSYLFSSYGPLQPDQMTAIQSVDRRTAVVGCSLVLLVVGLALIYVPWLRRPACLYVLTLAAVAVGVLYPGPFLLVAQAGLLGLILAGLAAVLAMVLGRPPAPEVGVSSSSLMVDSAPPGTDTLVSLPLGMVSTNAPTVSMPPTDSQSG